MPDGRIHRWMYTVPLKGGDTCEFELESTGTNQKELVAAVADAWGLRPDQVGIRKLA